MLLTKKLYFCRLADGIINFRVLQLKNYEKISYCSYCFIYCSIV